MKLLVADGKLLHLPGEPRLLTDEDGAPCCCGPQPPPDLNCDCITPYAPAQTFQGDIFDLCSLDSSPYVAEFEEACCGTQFWAQVVGFVRATSVWQRNQPGSPIDGIAATAMALVNVGGIQLITTPLQSGNDVLCSRRVQGTAEVPALDDNDEPIVYTLNAAWKTDFSQQDEFNIKVRCPRPFEVTEGATRWAPGVAGNEGLIVGSLAADAFLSWRYAWQASPGVPPLLQAPHRIGRGELYQARLTPGTYDCPEPDGQGWNISIDVEHNQQPGMIASRLVVAGSHTNEIQGGEDVEEFSIEVSAAVLTVPAEDCDGPTGLPPPSFPGDVGLGPGPQGLLQPPTVDELLRVL